MRELPTIEAGSGIAHFCNAVALCPRGQVLLRGRSPPEDVSSLDSSRSHPRAALFFLRLEEAITELVEVLARRLAVNLSGPLRTPTPAHNYNKKTVHMTMMQLDRHVIATETEVILPLRHITQSLSEVCYRHPPAPVRADRRSRSERPPKRGSFRLRHSTTLQ